MEKFTHYYMEHSKQMRITLLPDFMQEDWPSVVSFYKPKIEEGILNWELDLTRLSFISSISIGQLVVLNTSVRAYSGKFTLILSNESPVTNQIRFARLNEIISCNFVEQESA